jgi:hypothetical protein
MTIANPQSFNRYRYVGNDPVNMRDPSGLMTQSGQPDPEIPAPDEPPGGDPPVEPPGDPFETGSRITNEAASRQASAIENRDSDTGNAPAPGGKDGGTAGVDGKSGEDPAGGEPQDLSGVSGGASGPWSVNATMVVIWGPGGLNRIGHVSYIFMQNDRSLSWEGEGYPLHNRFSEESPSARYTDERSKTSEGRGYILDFGTEANAKFQKALRKAYEIGLGANAPYDPLNNNCAHAFVRAMNAIRKDIRAPMIIVAGPATIETYIRAELMPRHYVKGTPVFPKH